MDAKKASKMGQALAMWVETALMPDRARPVAKSLGYNDSPLFGRTKKRANLIAELHICYTALVMYLVNQGMRNDARPIIDSYLEHVHKTYSRISAASCGT